MSLSDREKEVLEQLEASLEGAVDLDKLRELDRAAQPNDASAPRRADSGTGSSSFGSSVRGTKSVKNLSPRRIFWGAMIALIGLVGLLTGVTIGYNVTGLVVAVGGVLLMNLGMYISLTKPKGRSSAAGPRSGASEFGQRQREKLNKRRQQPQ